MMRLTLMMALAAGSATLLPGHAAATSADLANIVAACTGRLKMSAETCACIEKRVAKLSDAQQSLVLAFAVEDNVAKLRIGKTLTQPEVVTVQKLVATAPKECAAGQ